MDLTDICPLGEPPGHSSQELARVSPTLRGILHAPDYAKVGVLQPQIGPLAISEVSFFINDQKRD